jgi:DNA-binding Lrp family transcriptional regulator
LVTAIGLVRAERERVQEAAQAVLGVEGVTDSLRRDRPDLVVMVRIPDFERLAEIVPEKLAQIPGIDRTETIVAFRCYPTMIPTASGRWASKGSGSLRDLGSSVAPRPSRRRLRP